MTVSDIKTYFPPDILNALADDNEDSYADDTVIQRYIDDALPVIQAINPDLDATSDANLVRTLTAKYVIKELYSRFGLRENATSAHEEFVDLLERATGVATQLVAEVEAIDTSVHVDSDDQVFDEDAMELW